MITETDVFKIWNMQRLSQAPTQFPPPKELQAERLSTLASRGISPIWFEGEPFNDKPTRIFAWYGKPKQPALEKYPAMVLVHGGGGTAFTDWVEYWNQRGYAAIAIDHDGHIPVTEDAQFETHGTLKKIRTDFSGPPPYGFDQLDLPPHEQWPYHAVAAIIRANSLLRSLPEVDPERIGIQGVSWGGYLTCFAASLDTRFQFAMTIYGCGNLNTHSVWAENELAQLTPEQRSSWNQLWDPARVLHALQMPWLSLTGTNDFAYWLPAYVQSTQQGAGAVTRSIKVRMEHSHHAAWQAPENVFFADSQAMGEMPLAEVIRCDNQGQSIQVYFKSQCPIVEAELIYTLNATRWPDRAWKQVPAKIESDEEQASCSIPDNTICFFINLTDARGGTVSSHLFYPKS